MLLYRWLSQAATERGNEKALVYRDTYLAWRGLLHRVDRRAQELHSLGIDEGSWVGLMLGNVPDFLVLALAVSKLKAVLVPIDPTTASRELELVLATTPLRALITRPRGGERVAASPPSREPLPARRGSAGGRSVPAARSAPAPLPEESPQTASLESRRRLQGTLLTCSIFKCDLPNFGVRPELVLLTSDSAGDPKGVLRTAENLTAATVAIAGALEIQPDERLLMPTPVYHAYGMDFGLLTMLRHGLTLYLEDDVSPSRIAKLIREQEIQLLPGTPTLYAALAKVPTSRPLKTKGARFLSTGSKLPKNVADTFRERYDVRLLSCYHTTETGIVALDRRGQNPESVGKPVDGVDVRLGPREQASRKTASGVVWVRGATVAARTIGPYQPAADRNGDVPVGQRDADGYYRTGDLASWDKSGRLVLAGREDDLVKVDGKRVALGEVQGCLESFPKVKQARARVVTDPLGGPMVVAKVVAAGRCDAEEIIDHCARNLAPYKVPRRIEFCESLG